MFSGLGNVFDVLRNAKQVQARMAELQRELAAKRFEAETGGGAVRITVDGRGTVVDVRIAPHAAQDIELLEDLVKAAIGAATARAQEAMREELRKAAGGLNLPGLNELFPA